MPLQARTICTAVPSIKPIRPPIRLSTDIWLPATGLEPARDSGEVRTACSLASCSRSTCASPVLLPSALRSLDQLWIWSMKAPGTTQFARDGRNTRIVPEPSSDPQQLKSSRAFEAARGALPREMSVALSFQCRQWYGRLRDIVQHHRRNCCHCSRHVATRRTMLFFLPLQASDSGSTALRDLSERSNESANRGILVTTSNYEPNKLGWRHTPCEACPGRADRLRFLQRRRARPLDGLALRPMT
jgi:hypothetical protein